MKYELLFLCLNDEMDMDCLILITAALAVWKLI